MLEELSLEVPTTVDEWHKSLTAFKETKGVEIPFTYLYTNIGIRNANPILLAYVISPGFYLGEDNKVQYGSVQEGYRQYLETFSKRYQEGLLDIDLASQKEEQVAAKMTWGQSGASVGYTEGDMGLWTSSGRSDNPDFELTAVPWPTLGKGQKPKSG